MTVRLGVNVDHVATIRNARGGDHPDPVVAARLALATGADGITVHLREDRRHIRDDDVRRLMNGIAAPLNLEMAVTDAMLAFALEVRPHACCLVPERRAEGTTEGGLDVAGQPASFAGFVTRLRDAGIRVSVFVDPGERQIEAAARCGAAVVELHTGAYAEARGGDAVLEAARLAHAAELASGFGLECHAGHGLTFENVAPIAAPRRVRELNIGHFLVGEAMIGGLGAAVHTMKRLIVAASLPS